MPTFEYRSRMPVSAAELFAWHARPGALERLLPPWQRVRVLSHEGGISDGARVVLEMGPKRVAVRWVARHSGYRDGEQFCDEQIEGPFAQWVHTHRCLRDGRAESLLEDQIVYALPLGAVGAAVGDKPVRRMLQRMFHFRHQRTRDDLTRHHSVAAAGTKRVVISGASGLVGGQLAAFLGGGGHRIHRLVRSAGRLAVNEIFWDPAAGSIDSAGLEGVDAVVHLAGENLFGWRWTAAKKRAIRDSREHGTQLLAATLARLQRPPQVLIAASAIGVYGEGTQPMAEDTPRGTGFLADVCAAWEAATQVAEDAGIRVVRLRIGVVLSARGGALATMLPPFQLGVGGTIGSGRQYFSWIGLDDLIGVMHFLLFQEGIRGAVNAVAPQPLTNAQFTHTLGRVLGRPTLLPLPAPVVRAALGEMGEEMLLKGAQVVPARLTAAGFPFLYPDLEGALRHELGRPTEAA